MNLPIPLFTDDAGVSALSVESNGVVINNREGRVAYISKNLPKWTGTDKVLMCAWIGVRMSVCHELTTHSQRGRPRHAESPLHQRD